MNPKAITEVLDIADIVDYKIKTVSTINLPAVQEEQEQTEEEIKEVDFDYVRSNQFEIIEAGKEALNGALELAKSAENPRAYEVVGTLMKSLSDINQQLLAAHELKEKIKSNTQKEESSAQTVNNTQNNIIFQGTTADLLKQIRGMQ